MINIDISDRTYAELLGLLGGVVLLLTGNAQRAKHNKLTRTCIRVEGEVVEIKATRRRNLDFREKPNYYPVIRFETKELTPIIGEHDVFASSPSVYRLWEKVNIIYDPVDPQNFTVDNASTKLAGLVSTLIGALMLIAAIIFYIFNPDSYIRF